MIDQCTNNAKKEDSEATFRQPKVPWWLLGVIVVMTIFYPYVGRMVPSYGPVLPAVNGVVTVGFLYFALKYYF
jgi:hypothetical protein